MTKGSLLGVMTKLLAAPLTARPGEASSPNAVAILGAPVGAGPGLSPVVEERVSAGVDLYHRGCADLVCITGTAAEAEAMASRAIELGVARSDLVVDAEASSTYENAANVAALLRERGRDTAWVVTQPFHSRRACFWFRYFGVAPIPWHESGSLQYRDSRKAARWIAREYASWVGLVGRFVIRPKHRRARANH